MLDSFIYLVKVDCMAYFRQAYFQTFHKITSCIFNDNDKTTTATLKSFRGVISDFTSIPTPFILRVPPQIRIPLHIDIMSILFDPLELSRCAYKFPLSLDFHLFNQILCIQGLLRVVYPFLTTFSSSQLKKSI